MSMQGFVSRLFRSWIKSYNNDDNDNDVVVVVDIGEVDEEEEDNTSDEILNVMGLFACSLQYRVDIMPLQMNTAVVVSS